VRNSILPSPDTPFARDSAMIIHRPTEILPRHPATEGAARRNKRQTGARGHSTPCRLLYPDRLRFYAGRSHAVAAIKACRSDMPDLRGSSSDGLSHASDWSTP
jgi:hypothetical protein